MQVSYQEYHALGEAISALHSPQFSSRLIDVLKSVLSFDCAVILGHRLDKHPIYLYDSLPARRELLFQHYLTHAYQHDPFYLKVAREHSEGVFHWREVAGSESAQREYQHQFYSATGWQDEVTLAVNLAGQRSIVIHLGFLSQHNPVTKDEIHALQQRFVALAALCRQHWNPQPLLLAESGQAPQDLRHWVEAAIASFGHARLSPREQQITALLIQGLDSQDIAEQLGIRHGTVKNHRKRIYAQLNVASLSELFQLFLNHLIAAGYPSTPKAD
ncbi:helix-turn-helix transcriptional regulator [Vibrio sp. H11]|uniref:helix-turn-helix transcriptional regulator n=1 Tax=Vibrio sp. H11 TaxID=2565928 RepID=UPI0010A69F53|nr:helix-turn-helix transcriptional regulator [Vibrio sp. H11]